ncbi:MAG: polyhydroxyalkanoate synthesis repressor PhaR [Rhodobacter sp.]|nr:polyhydroxyalkanoate synthesis repressor PhaR [Rhodobacter sp.]MCY4240813.1 polyhydroxyalkanoate synthesis repressor PhaR [Rhodobacter sp.]
MADQSKPLLIKRYASRRLYNTETSDYVTLDDIAQFIRDGREVQVVDLKSGDDLTKQYLLQIIADHESQGDSVLPVNVLTDLVRSYATGVHSTVPHFLSVSFDMLRESQSMMMENFTNPMAAVPGFEAVKAQQEAFMKAMTGVWAGNEATAEPGSEPPQPSTDELEEIRRQLADLQSRLAELGG